MRNTYSISHNVIKPRRWCQAAIATICCAGSLIAAAHAAALQAPKDRTAWFEMRLTGTHKIVWQYADPAYPAANRIWEQGSGVQTMNVSMDQPARFRARLISSISPAFGRLVPLLLVPLAAPQPLSGQLARTQEWQDHDPAVCDREGGCGVLSIPIPPITSCPTLNVPVPLRLDAQLIKPGWRPRMGLYAELSGNLDGLWPHCPPDLYGVKRPLALALPPRIYFTGAIHQLFVLRRGQTVKVRQTLRRSAIDRIITPGCPKSLEGSGLHECAVTDLTLQITRVR